MMKSAHCDAEDLRRLSTKEVGNSAARVPITNSHCAMKVLIFSDSPPKLSIKLP